MPDDDDAYYRPPRSPRERQMVHEALLAAKPCLAGPELAGDKSSLICYALANVAGQAPPKSPLLYGSRMARTVIQKRLHPCVNVTHWLVQRGLIDALRPNYSDIQTYRHRWLDHLIEEFSK